MNSVKDHLRFCPINREDGIALFELGEVREGTHLGKRIIPLIWAYWYELQINM